MCGETFLIIEMYFSRLPSGGDLIHVGAFAHLGGAKQDTAGKLRIEAAQIESAHDSLVEQPTLNGAHRISFRSCDKLIKERRIKAQRQLPRKIVRLCQILLG